ncbi:MAG: replication protein P [Halioglobus sp.]|nr:replication protein P [Halioglobus sp.]
MEAINQVFALFRLNYHNQYYAAYPDAEQLKQIKKLWLESLAHYPVEQILTGAKYAIENSEYLPTLNRMLECCREGVAHLGLPSPRDAYREACLAPSPRSAQQWSHPAVYLAGRDSDWFFLASNTEQVALPVFTQHYERYCTRALRGETLEIPAPAALEQQDAEPLSAEERLARIRKLREETGL